MTRLPRLPITLRAPLLVALLMFAVSAVVSEQVMRRLVETQERQLIELSSAYLDGLSSALAPHILREDMWEVFDVLDRSKALYSAVRPIETVAVDAAGRVIAASDPTRTPSLEPISAALAAPVRSVDFAIDEAEGRAIVRRHVRHQGVVIGAVYSVLDIRHLLAERSDVVTTLIITNALLTLGLAAVGYVMVRRMVAPMRVLTSKLRLGVGERAEPIPKAALPPAGSEPRRLFDAYNRLVEAERQREALARELAREETLASVGRLATGLAHEINNPLGGLFNALHTVKRHGHRADVRASAVDLIERGLVGIRNVAGSMLATHRPDRSRRSLTRADLEDVRLLALAAVKRRGLRLEWRNALRAPIAAPAAPVRQILLNLLLNACAAAADRGRVSVDIATCGDPEAARLTIVVEDDGPGLPPSAARILETPDASPPIGEGGLGLWMARSLTTELGGEIRCAPGAPSGSRITVTASARRASPEEETRRVVA